MTDLRKVTAAILKDPSSRVYLLIAISTLPLLAAAIVFVLATGLPDRCLDIDMSMLELYTLHASHGDQYLGPYSRFGWNHPGPSYFYLMVPLYWLSGESASSLFLTARIINFASFAALALVVIGVSRKNDRVLAIWTIVVLTIYLGRLGPDLLGNPWNPWIVILPFGTFVFCLAAFSTGRIAFLLPIVLLGSFLLQTHVGMVPCVLALCATSGALLILVLRSGHSQCDRVLTTGNLKWMALSVVLVIVMWILPLVEEIRHNPGNLSKLVGFFRDTTGGNPFFDAFPPLAKQVSWLPLYVLKKMPITVPQFEYDLMAELFTVLQMVLLPLVLGTALRKGLHFRACLAALGGLGVLAGMWSVLRIQGDIFPYLISWMSAIGLVNWAVIGTACIEYIDGLLNMSVTHVRFRSRAAEMAAAVAIVAMVGLQIPEFIRVSRHPIEDSIKVKNLAGTLMRYLQDNHIERPVILFDWSQWSVQAGVIVQLYKSGLDFAVKNTRSKHRRNWPLLFPSSYSPRGHNEKQILFGTGALQSDRRATPIGAYGESHMYLWGNNNLDGNH